MFRDQDQYIRVCLMGISNGREHRKCSVFQMKKKRPRRRGTKYHRRYQPRHSWADLLMARDCHHQWKGLPWLHGALTLVSFEMFNIPGFLQFCSRAVRLRTRPTTPRASCNRAWRVYGNGSVMNGSDTETNTLAKQGVLLQSTFERTLGNIIYWVLVRDDLHEKQLF